MHLEPTSETMEMILSIPGFNISHFDDHSYSLMATAVVSLKEKSLLEQLAKAGSNMQSYLNNHFNLGNEIHFAIKFENINAVEFFFEQGVNLFEKNRKKMTPWSYAKMLYENCDISYDSMLQLKTLVTIKSGRQVDFLPIESNSRAKTCRKQFKIFESKNLLPDFYGSNFYTALSSLSNDHKLKSNTEVTNVILVDYFKHSTLLVYIAIVYLLFVYKYLGGRNKYYNGTACIIQ